MLDFIKSHPLIWIIPIVIIILIIVLAIIKKIKNRPKKEDPTKAMEKMKKLEERSFTLLDYCRFDYETYYTKHCAELLLAKDDETDKKFIFSLVYNHEVDWVDLPDSNPTKNPLKKFKKRGAKFKNGEKLIYGQSGGRYKKIKEFGTVTQDKKKFIIPCPYFNEGSNSFKILNAEVKPRKIKHFNKKIKVDELLDATYYDVYYIIDRP